MRFIKSPVWLHKAPPELTLLELWQVGAEMGLWQVGGSSRGMRWGWLG